MNMIRMMKNMIKRENKEPDTGKIKQKCINKKQVLFYANKKLISI